MLTALPLRPLRLLRPHYSGHSRFGRFHPSDRLAVSLTQRSELGQLLVAEVLVTLADVGHCVVEPVLLMLRLSLDDSATKYVAEQLVTSLGKRDRFACGSGRGTAKA